MTPTVLWVSLGLGGGGLLTTFVYFRVRASWRKRSLRRAFQPFHQKVVQLLDELEAVRKRHDQLPFSDLDYSTPMTGETRRVYQQVDVEIDRIRSKWLLLMEARQQIEILLDGVVGAEEEKRVRELLKQSESLAALTSLRAECVRQLDALENAHEALAPLLGEFGRLADQVDEHLIAVREKGGSTAPYDEERNNCRALFARAQEVSTADPLGTYELLPALNTRVSDLESWLGAIRRGLVASEQLSQDLIAARSEVEKKRADGLRLPAPNTDPDPLFLEAERRNSEARQSLEYGDQARGEDALRAARSSLDRGRRLVEEVLQAQVYCRDELPRKEERSLRLQRETNETELAYEQLENQHAPESWQHVAKHLPQARQLLAQEPRLFAEIREAASYERQEYLHAAELIERLEQQQEHAAYLLASVVGCLEELNQTRISCTDRNRSLDEKQHDVESYVVAHHRIIGEDVRVFLAEAKKLLAAVRAKMDEFPQNWPLIREQIHLVTQEFTRVERAAQVEVEEHRRATERLDVVRRAVGALGDLLSKHTEDRPRTNQAFAEARRAVEDVERRAQGEGIDWSALRREIDDVGREIETVQSFANSDIELADQARQRLGAAERAIQEAVTFRSAGVRATVSEAEGALAEGRVDLRRQEYEKAVEAAGRARRAARQALDAATAEARAEAARERRNRMERVASAAAAGATILGQVLRTAGYFDRRRGPWRRGRRPWHL